MIKMISMTSYVKMKMMLLPSSFVNVINYSKVCEYFCAIVLHVCFQLVVVINENLVHILIRGNADVGHVGREVEKIEVNIEKTRPGAVAATLKAADEMAGQTFNDVGPLDDEGVIRLDRHRKM